jgi:uncharacterized protein (DUF885 family)
MMLIRRFVAACAVVTLACVTPAAAPAANAPSANAQFIALAQTFFYNGFREQPATATGAGVHTYDAVLDDMSAAAVARRIAEEKGYLAKFAAFAPATLDAGNRIDRTLIVNAIRDDLLSAETLQDWRHNPDVYTGLASGSVFALISRDFAPLSTRLRDTIGRENAIPNLIAQAKANLTTVNSATQEISQEQAAGAAGFFAQTVPEAFAGVHDAALQAQLKASNAAVIAAMQSYVAFIKAMKPSGTFAIGSAAYEKRLQYEDALNMPVAQYLGYGERALAQTRAWFIATAKKINPNESPAAVYASLAKVHPKPAALLDVARGDLKKLRAFVVGHRIVTLPPSANISVIPTPPFERAFITAAEDSAGPLETVSTQAYYFVTPVDTAWPVARQEGFLAQFNDYQFPIISAHEVYPGHFTNFSIERGLTLSLTRKLLQSSEFAEGWAHYDEQMMVDQGWGNGDPHVRLAQLEEALLRECRYVVGVKLHTAGWTLKQAEDLFQTQCFQTPAVALEETMRGTQDPMYGYYTLGKLMILKLRADYQKKMGSAFSLQKFHDALLAHGDPPLPLVRPLLLGKADDGKPL